MVTLRAHRAERRAAHGRAVPRPGVDCVDDRAGAVRGERCRGVRPAGPAAAWADGSEWAFAVEFEGRYAGTISLRDEGPGRAEIAYGSHPDVRGTGTMLRALRLLVDWGFAELGLETIVWRAFTGNWPSRKLAWRLGVHAVEGTAAPLPPAARGRRRDAWVGTLLKDDPREPRTTWLDVPVLMGDGFRLRPVREDDAPRIHEGTAEPATEHWLGHKPAPYTLDDAPGLRRAAPRARRDRRSASPGRSRTPTTTGSSARCCGSTGRPGVECEVGWWTHPDARGRGLATKAARLAIGHVFETLGVKRVTAYAAVENTASRHVAERRRLPSVRRRAVRREHARRLGRHGPLRPDGGGVGGAVQRERDREHGEPGQRQPDADQRAATGSRTRRRSSRRRATRRARCRC